MTESDRELLEMAAKASGFDFVQWTSGAWTFGEKTECRPEGGDVWNPLVDDGDALRLACHLEIDILFTHDDVEAIATQYAQAEDQELISPWACENFKKQDKATAAKRAIVRTAAAIQKQKPEPQ